jgi:hypothetical protein
VTVTAYSIKDELIRRACSESAKPMSESCDMAKSLRAFAMSVVEHFLGVLGRALECPPLIDLLFLCLGLSVFSASTQAAKTKMDPAAKENCIKACNECLRACRECLLHGGCPACDKPCLTCLETCRACGALMKYDSPVAKEMCHVCEKATRRTFRYAIDRVAQPTFRFPSTCRGSYGQCRQPEPQQEPRFKWWDAV